jgi:hypothetical protein
MVAAGGISLALKYYWKWDNDKDFAAIMLVTVGVTTAAWLFVTFLTPPEPREKLVAFYRRARPAGPGWGPVAAEAGPVAGPSESLTLNFINWVTGCVLIYAATFGIGKLIFREWLPAAVCAALVLASAAIISRNLSRADWREQQNPLPLGEGRVRVH